MADKTMPTSYIDLAQALYFQLNFKIIKKTIVATKITPTNQ
ncbi:hypothetical protein ECDEC3D_2041 [Escherichia coli DEC3D]|nr:hypothetical protein ECDEC3D_2041 [Escherichia coli DEC3D]